MQTIQFPLKTFISYSHKDKKLKERLITHLNSLIRQNYITVWYDNMILPGEDIDEKILRAMRECQMALLLISADYLNSKYCYEVEMQELLTLRKKGVIVIPVLLKPVDLEGTPFAGLKSLPDDRKAVNAYSDKEEAFSCIAKGIRKIIEVYYKDSVPGMGGNERKHQTKNEETFEKSPVIHSNYGFQFYGDIYGGSFEINK